MSEKMVKAWVLRVPDLGTLGSAGRRCGFLVVEKVSSIAGIFRDKTLAVAALRSGRKRVAYGELTEEFVPESAIPKAKKTFYYVMKTKKTGKKRKRWSGQSHILMKTENLTEAKNHYYILRDFLSGYGDCNHAEEDAPQLRYEAWTDEIKITMFKAEEGVEE
jgi:hypothetical protein